MKDPYLKPVIFGGIIIAILSLIFAPGIVLWAALGGYIAVRLSYKSIKEIISIFDGILIGALSGLIGGGCLDVLTIITFKDPDNKGSLIRALERSWPKDLSVPNLKEMLPSIFITTCILILLISVIFSIIGGYVGTFVTKKVTKKNIPKKSNDTV